jgi:selenocysteine-specific elongation factor
MQRGITIGIAGHVDHGKTSLVKTLTGIDTDRMKVEKERGLSIESGVAPLTLNSGQTVALVDVPGHTDYLKNTIRGLSGVDLAIIVVAADDGIMPQSREHLDILKFYGAQGGFCVLSKADLVDGETLEIAELELEDILAGSFLENKPVIRFSAKSRAGSDTILQCLQKEIGRLPEKEDRSAFRLWVDRVKTIAGLGSVVSGTVCTGSASLNDTLHVLPQRISTRIRSMESHNQPVTRVYAGQRVGINLHHVHSSDLGRGVLLAHPGISEPGYLINVDMELLERASAPLKNRQRVKLCLGTAVVNAMVVLMEQDHLMPGGQALAQLRLLKPLCVLPRDRFVITSMNLPTVLGGGMVLEVPSEKFRNAKAERILPYLKALRTGDIIAFVDSYFAGVLGTYTDARTLSRCTGLPQADFEAQISARVHSGEFIYLKRHGAYRKDKFEQIKVQMLAVIQRVFKDNPLKKNINRIELMNLLDLSMDEMLFTQLVESLCSGGKLRKIDGGFMLPDSRGHLSMEDTQLADTLLAYSREAGLTPFSADTFWKEHDRIHEKATIKALLNYLYHREKLVRLNDQRFLSMEAMEEIKARVENFIEQQGCLRLADCKTILGYGRWGGVHVFDYLDKIGFTSRVGDIRMLKRSPTR